MKISIITVCYNSEATIRDTIESVLAQTHPDIEYILIDGVSSDRTLSIIDSYASKISKFVSEKDKGIYDAMNKGIKVATGDFIGILNSDDVFQDEYCVEQLVTFIKRNRSIDAVYSDLIYVKRHNLNKKTRSYKLENYSLWKVRFGFMMPHPTFYARRQLFTKFGLYKINYRVAADFELMLRFTTHKIKIGRCPMSMVKMREGGISSTGFWWMIHQNIEIVRACKENNFYTNIFLISLKFPFKLLSRFL